MVFNNLEPQIVVIIVVNFSNFGIKVINNNKFKIEVLIIYFCMY